MVKWIVVLMTFVQLNAFTQNATIRTNSELKKEAEKIAQDQIKQLEKGVILFRLNSKSEQIAYYEKYDNFSAAKKLKKETDEFNLLIIQGFRKSFSFCPIYFFEDKYSQTLLNGNIDSIIFYNDELIADKTIKFPGNKNYFIAEYGMTRDEDDDQFRSDYYYGTDSTGLVRKTKLYDDGNLGLKALVLMDSSFNQLQRPFPYYYRLATQNINLTRLSEKILNWNRRIENFYKSNQ